MRGLDAASNKRHKGNSSTTAFCPSHGESADIHIHQAVINKNKYKLYKEPAMSQTPRNDKDTGGQPTDPRIVDVEILEPEAPRGSGERGEYARGSFHSYSFTRFSPVDTGGCIAPCVTLGLFLVCLVQYGLLPAIGFFFFHLIGSIIGTLRAAHNLALGLPTNVWGWRGANWVISFLFTIWLSVGLD